MSDNPELNDGQTEAEAANPAPVEGAAAEDAIPQAAQMVVKTKKLTVKKVEADLDRPTVRSDGETRTETDQGPVQMATIQQEPREVEELEFPTLKITRMRF